MCRQCSCSLTYSERGGWNCTAGISSPKSFSLTKHISSQFGFLFLSDTEMCSRFIVLPSFWYSCTELITVSTLPVAGQTISSGCIPSFSSAFLFSSLMLFI